MNIRTISVQNPSELLRLKDKVANYNHLNFSFSADYIEKLQNHLRDKNAFQRLAYDDQNNLVGYIASIEGLFPEHQWIVELFVDPNFQQQGIGTQLIDEVIKFAKSKKLKGLITQTEFENLPAQRLYEKCGFVKIDNPDWKEGITYELKF